MTIKGCESFRIGDFRETFPFDFWQYCVICLYKSLYQRAVVIVIWYWNDVL